MFLSLVPKTNTLHLIFRYRGLRSFRHTPWDPKLNLPLDYGRIFQFANVKKSAKRAMDTSTFKIQVFFVIYALLTLTCFLGRKLHQVIYRKRANFIYKIDKSLETECDNRAL